MLGQSFALKRRGMVTIRCIRFSRHSFLLQICQKFNFGGHFTHNFRHWNFVNQSSDSVLSSKHIQLKKLFFFKNHMWTLNYRGYSYRYCFSETWVFLINLKWFRFVQNYTKYSEKKTSSQKLYSKRRIIVTLLLTYVWPFSGHLN